MADDDLLRMLCPTRDRPERAALLVSEWTSFASGNSSLLLAADDDDPAALAYDKLGARILSEPRGLGNIINALALEAAQEYPFVGFLGDDHRPRTVGWDLLLVEALGYRPGVAYGNDLYQGQTLATAVVISSPVITALGYMVPPGVEHLFMDNFWIQLGKDLNNLQYVPGAILEHEHPIAGKAAWDAGYIRANHPDQYARDGSAYSKFLTDQWPGDLVRLRQCLGL